MEQTKLKRCKRIEHKKRYKQRSTVSSGLRTRNSTVSSGLRTRVSTDDSRTLLHVKTLQQCLLALALTIEDVYR